MKKSYCLFSAWFCSRDTTIPAYALESLPPSDVTETTDKAFVET